MVSMDQGKQKAQNTRKCKKYQKIQEAPENVRSTRKSKKHQKIQEAPEKKTPEKGKNATKKAAAHNQVQQPLFF